LLFIGAVLGVIVLFVGAWLSGDLGSSVDKSGGSEKEDGQSFRTQEYIVQAGDTWEIISEKLVGRELGLSLLNLSENAHNLASIHAGNEFRFDFDSETNEFLGLEYDINKEDFLLIEKSDTEGSSAEAGFGIDIRRIEYETRQVVNHGVIRSSLFETAQEKGIDVGIILELAMIFSWLGCGLCLKRL